jgi:two-component system OmpR family response regulator
MSAKILIIDDNVVITKTLHSKLRAAGFEVVTVCDCGEALAAVRREAPDLIVLDILFPPDVGHGGGVAWDGFLLLQWLRRSEASQHTPVVFISIGNPDKYRARALDEGAIAFFTKPIDYSALVDFIHQTLHEPAAAA